MFNFKKTIAPILTALCLCFYVSLASAEVFTINKIEVHGLQGVRLGTLLNSLPIKEGDRIDSSQTSEIIRATYKTGFFDNVDVVRVNNNIIITVVERPAIGEINISGNKDVTKKELLSSLKDIGLVEGEIFNQAALSGLEQALVQQYYNLGHYNIKVETNTTKMSRNRVAVNIKIYEGPSAKIKAIKIIGNNNFSESKLLGNFSLTATKWWKFTYFSKADQYSKEKLNADLEKLRSFYLDRGYIRFKIDSTQVSITPDKKYLFIIVHVTEGAEYHISGYNLSGNLLGKGPEIRKLITINKGDVFSRQNIIDIDSSINQFVGNLGYAMPDINANPIINDKNHTVFLNFVVNPGKKYYIRRINFSGNNKTDEVVLRREMRQQEGALYSLDKINESKRRLSNLSYLENVDTKLEPVPEHPDQVDLTYKVKETSSASANFNIGYSDADGFLYGLGINENDFLGTGKTVAAQFTHSKLSQVYSLTYFDPYFTKNNVSMKVDLYSQQMSPDNVGLTPYSTDNYGGAMTFGIPISDFDRLSAGLGYDFTKIFGEGIFSSIQINNFIKEHGSIFHEGKVMAAYDHSSYDRAIFPTKGFAQSLNAEVDFPASSGSLSFYKAGYNTRWYFPLYKHFILHTYTDLGYGNGFGNTDELPFFKNYYAGGIGSVRGFEAYSLGPVDSNNNPMGGNILADASVGLIVPSPWNDRLRPTIFVDAGNTFNTFGDSDPDAFNFKFDELRASTGLQIEWRSPIGPLLVFAIAHPIYSKNKDVDHKKLFDFNVGASF